MSVPENCESHPCSLFGNDTGVYPKTIILGVGVISTAWERSRMQFKRSLVAPLCRDDINKETRGQQLYRACLFGILPLSVTSRMSTIKACGCKIKINYCIKFFICAIFAKNMDYDAGGVVHRVVL